MSISIFKNIRIKALGSLASPTGMLVTDDDGNIGKTIGTFLGGSGSVNTIAKFNSANTLSNSHLKDLDIPGIEGAGVQEGKRLYFSLDGDPFYYFFKDIDDFMGHGIDATIHAGMVSHHFIDGEDFGYLPVIASGFKKDGGTASQFLKADGSVDSTVYISTLEKGVPNGVATLDAGGLIPTAQLPSYVDDVLEYANLAGFPSTGEAGKIYVALNNNKTYRWSGSAYVYITSGAVDSVNGQTGVVNITTITGNAGSATVLQTARTINGTSFNGSANITTANWGTSRNLSIGGTSKSVNGSANVTWSQTEIGITKTNIDALGINAATLGGVSWGNVNTKIQTSGESQGSKLTAVGTLTSGSWSGYFKEDGSNPDFGTRIKLVEPEKATNGLVLSAEAFNGTLSYAFGTKDNVDIEFYTNGAERLRIKGGGNVGIGTTTPTYKLDVTGTGRFTGTLEVATATANNHAVNKAQLDAALQPFKVYTALITQTGTNAPTAIVLDNTLGGTVTFTFNSNGVYFANLTGAFTANKTYLSGTLNAAAGNNHLFNKSWADVDRIRLVTHDGTSGGLANNILNGAYFEIRVYN